MGDKVDFDDYSLEYLNLMTEQHSKFGDIEYYSEQKVDITKKIFNAKFKNILEFGCGVGRNLPYIQKEFNNAVVYGSDISQESLKVAKQNNQDIALIEDNGLSSYNGKFDLIFIAGVYHHIEPKLREGVAERLYKLLADNGSLVCFEHNPYNPLTRHMVNSCEFDEDAVLLNRRELIEIFKKANLKYLDSGYILFVPPKLKKMNFIEDYLKWLPLGGQYFVSFEKR